MTEKEEVSDPVEVWEKAEDKVETTVADLVRADFVNARSVIQKLDTNKDCLAQKSSARIVAILWFVINY